MAPLSQSNLSLYIRVCIVSSRNKSVRWKTRKRSSFPHIPAHLILRHFFFKHVFNENKSGRLREWQCDRHFLCLPSESKHFSVCYFHRMIDPFFYSDNWTFIFQWRRSTCLRFWCVRGGGCRILSRHTCSSF